MINHTPGPWVYDKIWTKTWRDENGEHRLAEIICMAKADPQSCMAVAYVWDDDRFGGKGRHNAKLIAAAPDLLAALQEAEHALWELAQKGGPGWNSGGTYHEAYEAVRKAINRTQR